MGAYDAIIIGAGISGLGFAHYCAKDGLNALVLEKSGRVGGTLHSHSFGNAAKDFWVELGAHTCYNTYRNLITIIEDCRISDRMTKREKVAFKMLAGNEIKSIPSRLSFAELLVSAPNLFAANKEGMSVESYYSKIVGMNNYKNVFGPAFNAVISQDAGEFPSDMLFKKRQGRRKDVMKKYTFAGGLQTIADAIASQERINILKGNEAVAVEFSNNRFNVMTGDNKSYESARLVLAAPASTTAKLLKGVSSVISDILSQVNVKSVESVGIAVKKTALSFGPIAGLIPSNDSFFSVVSRDTVNHDIYRGFTFHFRPGILNLEAKLKRISEALNIRPGQIEAAEAKENLVPSLKAGHPELINRLDAALARKGLFLTGNYFNGLAIEDCVSRSLSEFQRLKKTL